MASSHDVLLEAAEKAADLLHADTSVSLDETFRSLSCLRDHVEMLMDAVANSMPKDDEEWTQ
jgi:hypothetical protein